MRCATRPTAPCWCAPAPSEFPIKICEECDRQLTVSRRPPDRPRRIVATPFSAPVNSRQSPGARSCGSVGATAPGVVPPARERPIPLLPPTGRFRFQAAACRSVSGGDRRGPCRSSGRGRRTRCRPVTMSMIRKFNSSATPVKTCRSEWTTCAITSTSSAPRRRSRGNAPARHRDNQAGEEHPLDFVDHRGQLVGRGAIHEPQHRVVEYPVAGGKVDNLGAGHHGVEW